MTLMARRGYFMRPLPVNLNTLLEEPVEIRLAYAHDRDCEPEILRVLSKDSFWFVRDFVAMNLNTPPECLLALSQETDFRIRDDALRTISKLQNLGTLQYRQSA